MALERGTFVKERKYSHIIRPMRKRYGRVVGWDQDTHMWKVFWNDGHSSSRTAAELTEIKLEKVIRELTPDQLKYLGVSSDHGLVRSLTKKFLSKWKVEEMIP